MEFLILLRTVNTYVLGCTKIANLRIKVIEANVIGWLQKESINKNNKRWTIWKRASFFLLLSFAMPQRTLCFILQRYKFFTRWYTDFKKFIEKLHCMKLEKFFYYFPQNSHRFFAEKAPFGCICKGESVTLS